MTKTHTPRFEAYAERVRKSLRDQPFMHKMLGAQATRIEPGLVEISVPVTASMLQPHGNVHGIVASAVADSAAGYAAQTLLAEGYDVVTVEYKINYMAPGIGDTIVAVGEVIRAGRTLSVCSADVFAETDGERTAFAHFVTTMMAVKDQ
ncbi:MAG: PaaI family thioesterase [Gammaproteobacteria bacterium]